jgi:hypothetical protein
VEVRDRRRSGDRRAGPRGNRPHDFARPNERGRPLRSGRRRETPTAYAASPIENTAPDLVDLAGIEPAHVPAALLLPGGKDKTTLTLTDARRRHAVRRVRRAEPGPRDTGARARRRHDPDPVERDPLVSRRGNAVLAGEPARASMLEAHCRDARFSSATHARSRTSRISATRTSLKTLAISLRTSPAWAPGSSV